MKKITLGLAAVAIMSTGAWFTATSNNTDTTTVPTDEITQFESELDNLNELAVATEQVLASASMETTYETSANQPELSATQLAQLESGLVEISSILTRYQDVLVAANQTGAELTTSQRAQLLDGLEQISNVLVAYQQVFSLVA